MTAQTYQDNDDLQPPSCIVMGEAGSGKTDVLATLLKTGLEVFVIVTEPDGVSSLLDSCDRRKIPIDNLHWARALPAAAGWGAIKDMTTKIGSMDYEGLAKIKSGIGKTETREAAMRLLECLENFPCARTQKNYGDFTSWNDTRCLVLDSLSGLSYMAQHLTIGYKPTSAQGEWGVAMNWIDQLLLKINSDRNCFFVMTAHIEKELNEITGVNQIMVSTLGKKLAPKMGKFFSEVIWAKRRVEQPHFIWSTLDNAAALKNRVLPIGAQLEPDFTPVVEGYRNRLKRVRGSVTPSNSPTTP